MKTMALMASLTVLVSSLATAGELYGTITDGGKTVGMGVKVEIKAGNKSYSGVTDRNGSYRVFVREKGKCTLSVEYQKQSPPPSIEIQSYDSSVQYNLVLEKKDGKYSLKIK